MYLVGVSVVLAAEHYFLIRTSYDKLPPESELDVVAVSDKCICNTPPLWREFQCRFSRLSVECKRRATPIWRSLDEIFREPPLSLLVLPWFWGKSSHGVRCTLSCTVRCWVILIVYFGSILVVVSFFVGLYCSIVLSAQKQKKQIRAIQSVAPCSVFVLFFFSFGLNRRKNFPFFCFCPNSWPIIGGSMLSIAEGIDM